MNKKLTTIFIIFFVGIALTGIASATEDDVWDTFKQGKCISLYQQCEDCTYVTLDSIVYPNSTITFVTENMTKSGNSYNYSFCDTSELGAYYYTTCGDKTSGFKCNSVKFYVDKTGRDTNTVWISIIMIIILMGFTYLVVYKKNKMLGGMTFFLSGIIIMFIEPIISFAGIVIMVISIAIIVQDLMPKKNSVSSGRWINAGRR